ncbi:MAG TPA: SDR family NAD(P)-dependent oxidoreductase, partial [Acidobacteriota bacterium]|nr:SDR family NAD(P)-dependent oxidoreductase [Acidobacteriota bacterium]
MNRLLITGGAGFIGSRLVRRLCKQGFSITVLDNYSKPGADDFSDISDRITVVRADIRDSETVNSALKNADAVIHLAAMVSVQESLKKPAECFAINVQATENIINECARRNIKFIFASSAAVYGNQEDAIVTERVTPRPISPYGESKLKVEEICKKTPKLNFVCLRQFNVYGPKQTINYAYASVVPQFLHAARTNKPLIIYGDGEQTRDFIHIDDIVNAYIKSIQSDVKGIFNVGTGTTCTINQLATLIIAATQSKSKVIKKKARDADIKRSQPSIKAFCEATQWRPTATIEHGIFALSLQADV